MTDEELRRLARKELLAYVKGEATAMCPASQNYWKEHLEKTLNRIAELEATIANHEYYQNGYKAAEKDCRVKFDKELYEKDNAIEIRDFRIKDLEKEKCELLGSIQGKDKTIADLQNENVVLKKALNLYVYWVDECGVAWENFPDMREKWYKVVEEKGLGWIDGLVFMTIEEAKEQLAKEAKE
jgi:hypothetical protein